MESIAGGRKATFGNGWYETVSILIAIEYKIGELRKSEAAEFLRLCHLFGINHNTDLRWVVEDSYPMLFRGLTPNGEAFTELWEEARMAVCAVPVDQEVTAETVIPEDNEASVRRVVGTHCPAGDCRRQHARPFIGADRRRWVHRYR